ncbi:unnamed protein product [Effrenium voratum]|nr:unnamed protein product [Effrenium voratum]
MALVTLRFLSGESLGKFRVEPSDSVETLQVLGNAKLPVGQCIKSLLLNDQEVSGPLEALKLEEEPVFLAVVAENEPETYFVHDNGGRPFKVKVLRSSDASPGKVWVYPMIEGSQADIQFEMGSEHSEEDQGDGQEEAEEASEAEEAAEPEDATAAEAAPAAAAQGAPAPAGGEGGGQPAEESSEEEPPIKYEDKTVLEEAVERIFVGTSPEHGKGFNGNSLLLKKSKNQYIFVGDSIFSFESEAEICKFSSPVGNNDVPYPWAADVDGRCYLVIENTVLSAVPEGDPYEYFYGDDFEKRVDWKLLWNNQPTGAPFDAAEQYQRMMGSKGKKDPSSENLPERLRLCASGHWARGRLCCAPGRRDCGKGRERGGLC